MLSSTEHPQKQLAELQFNQSDDVRIAAFDINDFYFSGHTGSSVIYSSEYIAMKWNKMAAFCIFVLLNVLLMMVVLRTHYIIDLQSGFVWARLSHRFAEKLSYYSDVKFLGYPREKRISYNYDPCPRCGWGNKAVLRLTTLDEVEM